MQTNMTVSVFHPIWFMHEVGRQLGVTQNNSHLINLVL